MYCFKIDNGFKFQITIMNSYIIYTKSAYTKISMNQ